MVNLPKEVIRCLNQLRQERPHYVSIKRIKGKYYAFEVTGQWDKALKKNKTFTAYLGRIKEDGTFIRALHRKEFEEKGRIVTRYLNQRLRTTLTKREEIILRNLSMNGRVSTNTLAKKLGLSENATRYNIQKTEKQFGIRYIAELDIERLGYQNYITLVKFINNAPSSEYIKNAMENESQVQLTLLTRGEYDLIIFSTAKDSRDIAQLVYRLLSTIFSLYQAKWYTSPYYSAYNFIPLREQFFDLLKGKVWKRSKEFPKPQQGHIQNVEYLLLKELNNNGAAGFTEIDQKYGLSRGTSRYVYSRLKDAGIIKRVTISMDSSQVRYNAIIIASILNGKRFTKTRPNFLFDVITETTSPFNKYVAIGDMEIPKSIIFILPVISEGELEATEDNLKAKVEGINVRSLIATEIATGTLCYRKIDNTYTRHYESLVEEYKLIKAQEKEEYN